MTLSLLVAALFASNLLIGFIPTLMDCLKKSWQVHLNQSPERLEWALRLFYFVWLPAMPLTGWMLDVWHNREILFFGLCGLILGLFWLGMVKSLSALMGNMLLLGCAYSAVTTSAIRLISLVLFPEPLPLAALNLGFIAVALGALLGPGIADRMERWWGYRQGLLYLSLACIVPAALVALSDRQEFPTAPRPTPDLLHEVFLQPHVAMIALILLLYFAIETCLEFWPEPYLRELGYTKHRLHGALLLFWVAFMGARAVVAWWFYLHPGQDFALPLTLILVIASAMVMGNLSGGYEVGSGSFGFWLTGACYGPLLPDFLGIALQSSDKFPTAALGLLLGLSGLDTLIVRPLMVKYMINRPARTVMRVPIILALLLAAPLFYLAFARSP